MTNFNKAGAIAMLAKIPDDEPVFVLRAQDRAAVYAIESWISKPTRSVLHKRSSMALKSTGWRSSNGRRSTKRRCQIDHDRR
jgi:hypothetical protein